MGLCEDVAALGADVDEAVDRLCGDKELYEDLLQEILEDFENCDVKSCLEFGDINTASLNAHTLKGVTGNLSLTPLFKKYEQMNYLLKAGKVAEAESMLDDTLELQQKFIDCISQYK